MTVDRNTQINFQGDPAKEKAFIESQNERTVEGARAAEPQLVITDNSEFIEAVKAADVLDPTQAEGYVNDDAKPGSEQGAHVNAEFEENVRTGADESGDEGSDDGAAEAPLTSGYSENDNPEDGPQFVHPDGVDGESQYVEQASPEGGDVNGNETSADGEDK